MTTMASRRAGELPSTSSHRPSSVNARKLPTGSKALPPRLAARVVAARPPASTPLPAAPPEDLSPVTTKEAATQAWLNDLRALWSRVEERFPDLCWTTAPATSTIAEEDELDNLRPVQTVWAHRSIVLSRAPKSFTRTYLNLPEAAVEYSPRTAGSSAASTGSSRSPTPIVRSARTPSSRATLRSSSAPPSSFSLPQNAARALAQSRGSSPRKPLSSARSALGSSGPKHGSLKAPSLLVATAPSSLVNQGAEAEVQAKRPTALSLGNLDVDVLKEILNHLYTGSLGAQAVEDALTLDALCVTGSSEDRTNRLRSDLCALWQLRTNADVTLKIEGAGAAPGGESATDSSSRPNSRGNASLPDGVFSSTNLPMEDAGDEEAAGSFACHRTVLVSRSPYFAAFMLASYSDSSSTTISLPSPPFTPTALYFTLGFLYTGTLQFSSRSFDLTIAFQIWRAGAYLQVKTLTTAVSSMILHDFCHDFQCSPPCKTCVKRVPRTLAFSSAPDVAHATLRTGALRALTGQHFAAYWGREVGSMGQGLRDRLLERIRADMRKDDGFVVDALIQSMKLARMLEGERSNKWTDSLRAMVGEIEREAQQELVKRFESICQSKPFQRLAGGTDLFADVLHKLLDLVVAGVDESKAPTLYQVLVGKVLLSGESGMAEGPERNEVEAARQSLIKYMSKRWVSAKAKGAFNDLEKWALKEIAGELDVPSAELILDGGVHERQVSKTGLKAATLNTAARRLVPAPVVAPLSRRPTGAAGRPVGRTDENEREAGPVNLRAAVLNRNAAKVSAGNASTSSPARSSAAPRPAKAAVKATSSAKEAVQDARESVESANPSRARLPSSAGSAKSNAASRRSSSPASSDLGHGKTSSLPASPASATLSLASDSPPARANTMTLSDGSAGSSSNEAIPPPGAGPLESQGSNTQEGECSSTPLSRPVLGTKVAGLAARFSGDASLRAPPDVAPASKPGIGVVVKPVLGNGSKHSRSGSTGAAAPAVGARRRASSGQSTVSLNSRASASRLSSRASSPAHKSTLEETGGRPSSGLSNRATSTAVRVVDSFPSRRNTKAAPATVATAKVPAASGVAVQFPRLNVAARSSDNEAVAPGPLARKLPPSSRAASVANLASLKSSVRRRHTSMLQQPVPALPNARAGNGLTPRALQDEAASQERPDTRVDSTQPDNSSPQSGEESAAVVADIPSDADPRAVDGSARTESAAVVADIPSDADPPAVDGSASTESTHQEKPAETSPSDSRAGPIAPEDQQLAPRSEVGQDSAAYVAAPRLDAISCDSNATLSPVRSKELNCINEDPRTPTMLRKMVLADDDIADVTPRPSKAPDSPHHSSRPSQPPSPGVSSFVPAASLSVGIPCLIWPSLPGLPPRTKFRALVKYIGPLEGRAAPVVGVEIPRPIPKALRRTDLPSTDGSYMGKRYFFLGAATADVSGRTTPCSGVTSPASIPGVSRLSEHLDMFARAEREARRRRIARLQASASAVSGNSTPVTSPTLSSSLAFPTSAPVSPGVHRPQPLLGQLGGRNGTAASPDIQRNTCSAENHWGHAHALIPHPISRAVSAEGSAGVGRPSFNAMPDSIRVASSGQGSPPGDGANGSAPSHPTTFGALRSTGPSASATAAKWSGSSHHLLPFLGYDWQRERRSSWSPSLVAASVRSMSRSSRPPSRSSRTSSFATSSRLMSDEEDEDEEGAEQDQHGIGLFVSPDEVMWVFEDE
ncbi:unnamed protein product [Parajaminaea phylloscopi]